MDLSDRQKCLVLFVFVCVCVAVVFFFYVRTRLTECHAVGKWEYWEIVTHYGPGSRDMLTA